jgi:lysylphosphatidylglycerol synthetase-like protein (DUF2156 family)
VSATTVEAARWALEGAAPTNEQAEDACGILARHGAHPSAWLALARGTAHLTVPGVDGLVAFRASGDFLFQLGGPFSAPQDRHLLLRETLSFARARGKRVVALQVRGEDVPLYRASGFRLNQLGQSYALDLTAFSTRGQKFMQLRNKVQRAKKAGVDVLEAGVDLARTDGLWAELEAVTREWLGEKGAGTPLMEFMVGELGRPEDRWRRVLVARQAGRVVGFLTLLPAPDGGGQVVLAGDGPRGALLDLSRRAPDAPPGVSELLVVSAIERLRAEGVTTLHFGLTPLVGLERELDPEAPDTGRSAPVSWFMRQLGKGSSVYPAASQAAYKAKWGAVAEPEWFAWQGRYRVGSLWHLLKVTRCV